MIHRALAGPWTWLAVVGDGTAVCRILLGLPTRAALLRQVRSLYPDARRDVRAYPHLFRQLAAYVAGHPTPLDVPVVLDTLTPFQRRVLEACRSIPFGQVRTYRDLADHMGSPAACRAVGAALARNPVPLVVPCHRVVRTDGTLGGFSAPGGLGLKRRLLAHEGCPVRGRRVRVCS